MAGAMRNDSAGGPPGLTAGLAGFVTRLRWEDVPVAVRHEARRSLVNVFATALAGCRDPALEVAWDVLSPFSSDTQCTVIGRRRGLDMLQASALNAMAGNVFDFDDTHLPTIIHPSAPVAPALFALAQVRPMSGQDLLLAFILGVEVECRLGVAISPGHYQRGWHITSTCGVFGSAMAAARALGLDERQTAWALGSAAAQSCGLVETLGSMAKSMSVGNAARNGLLSALLAQRGFEGPAFPVEGPRGFLRVTGDEPDLDGVLRGLGEEWEILHNTYKPYPCGVVLNPVIEACLALHDDPGLDLAAVARIELTGNPLLRERTDRPRVRSGREAQVSAQHAVAVALTLGRAGLDEFSDACVADSAWHCLGDCVAFIDDASRSVESATVTIRFADGRTLSHHVQAARGSLDAPLSDQDLTDKLFTLTRWGRSGCDPTSLAQALWALEEAPDAGSVMALAAGQA